MHALGRSKSLPELRVESLAPFSEHWRVYRRRLRRLGSALAKGDDLSIFECDLLSEAAALLNSMRGKGVPVVGWPNAWLMACQQRDELDVSLLVQKVAKTGKAKDRQEKDDMVHSSKINHRL